MTSPRFLVTGGCGKAGRWVVRHLLDLGCRVTNVDSRPSAEVPEPARGAHYLQTDLTDLGQTIDAFSPHSTGDRTPYDGVIHFAAIPRPQMHPNVEVWRVNTTTTYNVLEACGLLGIRKAVVASSESSYGICFANTFFAPRYLPVDEAHPQLPEDTYGLTKVVNEATAAMFHRRDGTQILSFRIGNVLEPEDHAVIRARAATHPEDRLRILWSYIDARDLAEACRLGLVRDGLGCEPLNIAADESSSALPARELIARFMPGVTDLRGPFAGRESFVCNRRAKAVLGWQPMHLLAV